MKRLPSHAGFGGRMTTSPVAARFALRQPGRMHATP